MSTNIESPKPCNLPQRAISELAGDLAQFYDYIPGGDLRELVQKMGGTITYRDYWNGSADSSGSIEIDQEGFEIRLSMDTGPLRDRFTVAHELGHYVLHYLYPVQVEGTQIERMTAERYGSGRVETEANWFAASLLMPESEFRKMYADSHGNITAVALHFRVSVHAATVRARALGILND